MLRLAREVVADELEEELRHHKNFIPQLMILKGYRPMFRENYHIEMTNSKLEELLEELKELGRKPAVVQIEEPKKESAPQLELPIQITQGEK